MRDPVCYTDVQIDDFTLKLGESRYYFCSKVCLEKFKAHPKRFAEEYINDLVIVGAGPAVRVHAFFN